MDILVTGASGFLGRALCRQLARGVHEVIGIGRRRPTGDDAPKHWIEADLSEEGWEPALPSRIDAVVHLAQSDRYRDFPGGAAHVFRVNVASTARLADYARRAGATQFCFASTGSVYEPYNRPLTEDALCAPAHYYPASKLAAEHLLGPYSERFRVSILRLFFLYGPGENDRLIANLADRIRSGAAIVVEGQGDGLVLTPTHVDDVAFVIARSLDETWGGVVNVAGNDVLSIVDIARKIGNGLGKKPIFERHPKNSAARIVPNLARLAARIDPVTFRSFDVGLEDVLHG